MALKEGRCIFKEMLKGQVSIQKKKKIREFLIKVVQE